jgi:aryl-alcohol dehydrogenase-like predicted oxidoreductase
VSIRCLQWTNLLIGGGFRLGRKSMLDALRATLQRLGTDRLDLWQIHFPFPTWPQSTLAEGLREAYDDGLVSGHGSGDPAACAGTMPTSTASCAPVALP